MLGTQSTFWLGKLNCSLSVLFVLMIIKLLFSVGEVFNKCQIVSNVKVKLFQLVCLYLYKRSLVGIQDIPSQF